MIRSIISLISNLLQLAILVRAVLSWMPLSGSMLDIYSLMYSITEPILKPCRELLWRIDFFRQIPIDVSPIVAMMLIRIAAGVVTFLIGWII